MISFFLTKYFYISFFGTIFECIFSKKFQWNNFFPFQIMHEETETTYNQRIWVPVPCPTPGPDEDGLLIVNLVSSKS
jgi:hypothetical protein